MGSFVAVLAFFATLTSTVAVLLDGKLCYTVFPDALPGIFEDLSAFATSRITAAHVDAMRVKLITGGTHLAHDGVGITVIDNVVYVEAHVEAIGGWPHLTAATYATTLHRMTKRYALPDVTFFVSTSDHSDQFVDEGTLRSGELSLPIMRACKTWDSPTVLLPTYALWEHNAWVYANKSDSFADPELKQVEWEARENVVFTAYTPLSTASDGQLTTRYNERGQKDMDVRATLTRFGNESDARTWRVKPLLNSRHEDIHKWGRYKYIAHVTGVTCSNKLEKIALLGSTLLLEEEGYVSTLQRILRPWVSYVPFYRFLPQELRDRVNWLDDNPDVAKRIAEATQTAVRHYHTMRGVECQLLVLLREYSKLQTFAPRDVRVPAQLPYREFMLACFVREFHGDGAKLDAWEKALFHDPS